MQSHRIQRTKEQLSSKQIWIEWIPHIGFVNSSKKITWPLSCFISTSSSVSRLYKNECPPGHYLWQLTSLAEIVSKLKCQLHLKPQKANFLKIFSPQKVLLQIGKLAVKSGKHAPCRSWHHHLPSRPFKRKGTNCSFIISWAIDNKIAAIQELLQVFITNIFLYHFVLSGFFISKQCQNILFLISQIRHKLHVKTW